MNKSVNIAIVGLGQIGIYLYNELRNKGVGVNVHYIPIHTQPYFSKFGFKEGDFPNSENYYQNAISLPLFHHMTIKQQDFIISAIDKILN